MTAVLELDGLVKHFRGSKLVEEADLYDLMLKGVTSTQAHIDSGDSILVPPAGAQVTVAEPRRVTVRFDRTATTASQVAAALMNQVEVKDFSLSEPDLASVILQIYNGALSEQQA